jgi:hypothetical protein
VATTYFCDTTILYYKLLGPPIHKAEVAARSVAGRLVLSGFVIGEFIRGYISGMLQLYMVIKEENDVREGCRVFADDAVTLNPRGLRNAFQVIVEFLLRQEDCDTVEKTLRRIADHIRNLLFDLDDEFPTREVDPLRCPIGHLRFPKEELEERHVLDFWESLQAITDQPQCHQCLFRDEQQKELVGHGVDLYSKERREEHRKSKGYVRQAKWMEMAARSKKNGPTCWYCNRLGDSIISLSCPDRAVILTGDRSSFPILAKLLGISVDIIPSEKELKRAAASPPRITK